MESAALMWSTRTVVANHARAVDLDHRAYFLRGAPRQSLCVAASREGAATLIDLDSGRTEALAGLPSIRDVYPHPTQRLLSVIDDSGGALSVVDYHGTCLLELHATRPRKPLHEWLPPGFIGCYFDQAGAYLWSVARLTNETVEVQLRDTEHWSLAGSVEIDDPFEESDCSFHETSRPETAALWMAAGQNGQRVYWVTKQPDSLAVEPEPFLEDTTPPVFSPKGDEFLAIDRLWSVCKYPFPADRKLGTCRSKWGEADYLGNSLCYLNEGSALVHTQQSRLFRIDVRTMKVREEIAVQGHEPRPVDEYYPTLAGDKALCTDISHFARVGEAVLLVYNRAEGSDPSKWKDTLLLYDVDSLAKAATRPERT